MKNYYSVFISKPLLFIAVITAFAVLAGCLPKTNPPTGGGTAKTPLENVAAFDSSETINSSYAMQAVDLYTDPANAATGTDSARTNWLRSRHRFERVRFAVEQFDWTNFQAQFAQWFPNPQFGYHAIEIFLFSSTPNAANAEQKALTLYGQLSELPTVIQPSTITDAGIFKGLEHMLADIDTIKFSKADSLYSRNSVNDIFSNYEGLDTVINYYYQANSTTLQASDSVFNLRYQAAWNAMLQDSASFYTNFNKQAYETGYLYPLDTAVAHVAAALELSIQ